MIDVMGIDHVCCGFDFFEFIDNPDTMGTMTDTGSPCTEGPCQRVRDSEHLCLLREDGHEQGGYGENRALNFQRVVKDAIG